MKFKLYREYGALNSAPVFDAIERGIRYLGHEIVTDNEDVPVIWSVLWHGRMVNNKNIYYRAKAQGKNVLILEVGNLIRGKLWRISLNNINRNGFFANTENLDRFRAEKLGVIARDFKKNKEDRILIALQHDKSLQWEGQPQLTEYLSSIVGKIRHYSDRKIVVRPHPRCRFNIQAKNIEIENPKKVPNTYDDFDIQYNFHCVVNFSSGPGIHAAINGTPIVVDTSSLAYPVSDTLENIETISLKDRTEWLISLSHTEWSIEEIEKGIPLGRLFSC